MVIRLILFAFRLISRGCGLNLVGCFSLEHCISAGPVWNGWMGMRSIAYWLALVLFMGIGN